MAVPGDVFSEIDLRHADAALDQAAGDQTAAGEVSIARRRPELGFALQLARRLDSVAGASSFGLLGYIERIEGGGLHAVGHLHGLNASFEFCVVTPAIQVQLVDGV